MLSIYTIAKQYATICYRRHLIEHHVLPPMQLNKTISHGCVGEANHVLQFLCIIKKEQKQVSIKQVSVACQSALNLLLLM